jgi:DNA adenine methylase
MPKRPEALLSPLRYPGSKRRLVHYIKSVIAKNELRPKLFVEPFVGGASVALQLLYDGVVEQIGLADKDPLITSFWKCVFRDTDWFVDAILKLDVTLIDWARWKRSSPTCVREQALKCLFLNRTSFSGIMAANAGPIGGQAQVSEYDIACRFNKTTITRRIRQAGNLGDKVAFIRTGDWRESIRKALQDHASRRRKDTLIYLDPPFYNKADRLYLHFFDEQGHKRLHDYIVGLKTPWLLSYDPAKPIEELYRSNGKRPKRVDLMYSITPAGQSPAKELIITNLPHLPRFARRDDS